MFGIFINHADWPRSQTASGTAVRATAGGAIQQRFPQNRTEDPVRQLPGGDKNSPGGLKLYGFFA